jgi:zinc transport system substrate-binding protein
VREYIKIDPTHAEDFKKNEEALIEQLEKTDRIIRNQLAPFAGQRFYVFHPAFGYFAQTYHLHQVAIELNGKAPAPRQLAQLIEQAKKDRVHVIFVQKQFPARTAEAIATAIQGVVVPLNPLAEQLPENFKIMAEHLSRGLKNE